MVEPTKKQKIGRLGEDIAVKHLENKGFTISCLNYRKKCGEIDIIAKNRNITHFIEVKTVSLHPRACAQGVRSADSEFANSETPEENSHRLNLCGSDGVSRETTDKYRPEDNIHPTKLKRLARTIQLYLYEKHANGEPEWQFDVITVRLDIKTKQAKVEFLENIII